MFRAREVWRHQNCLDMDLYVVKKQYSGPEYLKIRVMYMNRRSGDLFTMQPETVKVQRKDFVRWKLVKE